MSYESYVRSRLEKTSLRIKPAEWMKLQVKMALPLSAAAALSLFFITQSVLVTAAGAVLAFVIIFVGTVFALDYMAYAKAREVEDSLTDALELLASNVKAGLPIKDSMQLLMTDEFGQLGVEMSTAVIEMNTGVSMVDALRATRARVESQLYAKTIETLCRSVESGVNVDTVCTAMARNINDMRNITRDIRASTTTYTLFLGFAALVASPLLFALSSYLVEASGEIFAVASAQGTGGSPLGLLSFSTSVPPADMLRNFFLAAIAITSFFTSLGIGIVKDGSMRVGLKFVPFFLATSFAVFFVAKGLIAGLVGLSA
ncbi:MAG: type II secretion system F family protein [Candidatus Aenigmatarchaeota archaeon]|nr:MAG: type II secretion system F family protein [Candidatus Aenigmarchaeota archaeon]